jgi:hypothetical protein
VRIAGNQPGTDGPARVVEVYSTATYDELVLESPVLWRPRRVRVRIADRYESDVFDDPASIEDPRARENLAHFISLVEDLIDLSDLELELAYPELLR